MSKTLNLILAITLLSGTAFASSTFALSEDTLTIEQKISNWMRNFKKNNKAQIYRYKTTDSSIVFGSNKAKTFLTSVVIFDKKRSENRWYYYDTTGLFRVTISQRPTQKTSNKSGKVFCNYYFESGIVIYKNGDCIVEDPANMLTKSYKFQQLARHYLQDR
jgi:hypothetical protein